MEQDHMQREQPPSYTQPHDPHSLNLPSVPINNLNSIRHERTLPPLPVISPEQRIRPEEQPFVWPSTNPLTAYYQPGPSQLSPKSRPTLVDSPGIMEVDTPDSRGRRGGSVLSIDDPDVRLAAEALGDLRADFIQSPPQQSRTLSPTSPSNRPSQPEPLLSLLTTSHPLIGNAIGGSLSAYSASKNYSPRFKSSAEYVERHIEPVVNTVGSVGRMTGVEGGVRWFLGGRRPSHHKPSAVESANKRRKIEFSDTEMGGNTPYDSYQVYRQAPNQRRPSQASNTDSLPAYDDNSSPSYEATQQALVPTRLEDQASSHGSSWQSRLVLSTSGLSVAMSEESLRSLKYCLNWLRWANEHIGKVVLALKHVLEQYEQGPGGMIGVSDNDRQLIVRTEAERSALHARIADLKKDVLKTLKDVVDIVSKYAGGALPENARVLVRRHLTSLPQRFRIASTRPVQGPRIGEAGDMEVTEGANRVLVLAKEGLDMMSQVSGVLDGTIVSAEEWCERLGRSKREDGDATPTTEKHPVMPPITSNDHSGYPDMKMR